MNLARNIQARMKNYGFIAFIALVTTAFFNSCSTLEKTSSHGFTSGYYKLDQDKKVKKVYLDVTEERLELYDLRGQMPDRASFLSIPLTESDSSLPATWVFRKQSLDIDITTILLKYRPSVSGLQPQFTADLNFAMYAGWRHDTYKIKSSMDPLGKRHRKITGMGYDYGIFAGAGTTPVNPFTTNNRTEDDYGGMIYQMGIAGFLESNIASFGLSMGFDHLLNSDRKIWVYQNRPWIGFIVGIALN